MLGGALKTFGFVLIWGGADTPGGNNICEGGKPRMGYKGI